MAFPLVAAGARLLARKVLPRAGAALARGLGFLKRNPTATATAIGAGAGVVTRMTGRPTGGGGLQLPVERRGGSRLNPFDNDSPTIGGIALITDAEQVERYKAPPGYVLVRTSADPDDEPIAVLKSVAYALGLKKRPTRGGISAAEIRSARRVQNVIQSLTTQRQPKIKLKRGRR